VRVNESCQYGEKLTEREKEREIEEQMSAKAVRCDLTDECCAKSRWSAKGGAKLANVSANATDCNLEARE
jgi:hypothetical protein